MSTTTTSNNLSDENSFIASLEQTIQDMEFSRASNDIKAYMSVSQSLEGLLENEKTVKHIKDFVVDERCEENVLFLLDVAEYRKMYNDNNYSLSQKLLKVDKIVKQYLIPGSSYSQLYIPLTIIKEFNEQYNEWKEKKGANDDELPSITLFDNVEKVVLESVRRTSYQKFIRTKNIHHLLAMTVQDIRIQTETPIEL